MFVVVKLTGIADFDKYKYSGYSIGFDGRGSFSLSDGSGFDENVIIFGTDMSTCGHVHDKKKDSR